MSKFQRVYELKVTGKSGVEHTVKYPITMTFDINRRAFGSLNSGHFMLYNLNADKRGDIQFDNAIDGEGRPFELRAGYQSEGSLPVIFKGTLQRALSYREGPNIVTDIQVLDGGEAIQEAQVELTRNYPWDPVEAVTQLVTTMSPFGVKLGALGTIVGQIQSTRGVTWIGSTWDILKKLAAAKGGYVCIDLEKVYVMAKSDALAIPGAIPQLDSSTGLIGTPRRSGGVVDADMLFEPRIYLMQSIKLASSVNPNINGTYSVQAITHRGTISGARDSGGVVTSLSLQTLPEAPTMVTPA